MATVIVSEHQLSLAIGRDGQNARLAARLTGYKIDIQSDARRPEPAAPPPAPEAPPVSEAPPVPVPGESSEVDSPSVAAGSDERAGEEAVDEVPSSPAGSAASDAGAAAVPEPAGRQAGEDSEEEAIR